MYVRTLREFFNADVVKQLDLFHDELCLVDLDDECGAAFIPPGKAKLAKEVFDRLRYIYCKRLGILVNE